MSKRYVPSHAAPRRHRRAKIVLSTLVVLGLILGGVSVGIYRHLQGNISTVGMDGLGERPVRADVSGASKPMNVLVMGDDTRKGQGPAIGGDTPGLSDTTILLHLSADRKFAYGVSLPRDGMVQRPPCKTGGGKTDPGGLTQFNAAYAVGGPLCTVKTVEQLTGVRIDHFAVVKFKSFKGMVNAVGGVKVCLPEAVNDNVGKIQLPGGTNKLNGKQALDYVRVRHGIGDGGDVGRMKRQQAFIASMINEVVSAGTLTNPIRMYKFLNSATKGLTTDKDFADLGKLASVGKSLRDIGLDKITFVTVPWEPYPADPNRLQWKPEAKDLWRAIKFDKPLGSAFSGQEVTASKTPGSKAPKKTASSAPSEAKNGAGNGAGQKKAAQDEQAQMRKQYGLCA